MRRHSWKTRPMNSNWAMNAAQTSAKTFLLANPFKAFSTASICAGNFERRPQCRAIADRSGPETGWVPLSRQCLRFPLQTLQHVSLRNQCWMQLLKCNVFVGNMLTKTWIWNIGFGLLVCVCACACRVNLVPNRSSQTMHNRCESGTFARTSQLSQEGIKTNQKTAGLSPVVLPIFAKKTNQLFRCPSSRASNAPLLVEYPNETASQLLPKFESVVCRYPQYVNVLSALKLKVETRSNTKVPGLSS